MGGVNGRGLRTGELADRAGVNVQTLRYYERRGTGELHRRAQAKLAEIDARIDHLTQVRQTLLAVVAADCDSLTNCSCGLARPLPELDPGDPGGDG